MIRDTIQLKVLSRKWTFTEISNLKVTIETLASDIFSEMKLIERFELVRDSRINEGYVGYTFEESFKEAVMINLRGEIADTIKTMLSEATINFNGDKNEISERSMGGESHQERSADEKEDSEDEE